MTKTTRRRARLIILGSVLAALLLLSLAGLFLRHAIASFFTGRVLAQKGFHCDPISVHVPFAIPSNLELAATTCKVTEGPLESIVFKEPLSIQLKGLEIGALACSSLEINLRPSAHREVDLNTLGDMSRIVGLDEPVLGLLFDSAKLSVDKNPPLLATQAVMRRGGKQVARFRELLLVSSDEGITISSPRVQLDQATLLGEGAMRLTATPTAAVVTVVFAGDLKVKVVLDHIDATKPTADFNIAIGESKPPPGK